MGLRTKNLIFKGRWRSPKIEGELPKKGRGFGGEGLGKKEGGGVFEGVDTPMYTVQVIDCMYPSD